MNLSFYLNDSSSIFFDDKYVYIKDFNKIDFVDFKKKDYEESKAPKLFKDVSTDPYNTEGTEFLIVIPKANLFTFDPYFDAKIFLGEESEELKIPNEIIKIGKSNSLVLKLLPLLSFYVLNEKKLFHTNLISSIFSL